MKEQNFSNHTRIVPNYHFVVSFFILVILVGSIINLITSSSENLYSAILFILLNPVLILMFWYMRAFALKAQDRAIRAEENFRHFILTGKPLPQGLRMGQVVALRFAPDEEFVELTNRAVNENLGGKDIKQAIKNWKADHYRA
ncbi:MAG: DUF6526 family protein [Bacteroidota bacterium]